MTIHKFTHSCLYIQDENFSYIFDPGTYTSKEKSLDIDNITSVDYIFITHEHADHIDISLIKNILNKFPQSKIITNSSVQKILTTEQIQSSTKQIPGLTIGTAKHEKILGPEVENSTFKIGKIFNPGDSYDFTTSSEILILPIQAPWGHMVQAIEKAIIVKPRFVIPVHDWHWREEARKSLYDQAANFLQKHDIEVITTIDENPFTIR